MFGRLSLLVEPRDLVLHDLRHLLRVVLSEQHPGLVHVHRYLGAVVHPDVELELDGLVLLVCGLVLSLFLMVGYPENLNIFI